jgi:hypothetical protein
MNWGFFTICLLSAMDIGVNLVNDGKPRTGSYSFLTSIFASAVQITILLWAMHWTIQ